MIRALHLTNYRGFADFSVPLGRTNVLVGKNNAGKSTVIEAIRLVSLVANRYRTLAYDGAPEWTGLDPSTRGVHVSLSQFEGHLPSICHHYIEPPAMVTAKFTEGVVIGLYVSPSDGMFATISTSDGTRIQQRSHTNLVSIPPVNVLPQVGPLAASERLLNEKYVRSSIATGYSPLHFRNQLHYLSEYFECFSQLARDSWPGLDIGTFSYQDEHFSLMIRDRDFTGEASWMGHGLQVWLQMAWFLARCPPEFPIVLDEPDVYLHADLQRRLMGILKDHGAQVILTTHSVEMLAECEPADILSIDKSKSKALRVKDSNVLQVVIDSLGGIHHIQLARLASAKKYLMVEGDDADILGALYATLFPQKKDEFAAIPTFPIGGWSGLRLAGGSALLLNSAGAVNIQGYCLIDRDYRTDAELEEQRQQARNLGVLLHIWNRKEIENYLLIPSAIARTINKGAEIERRISADRVEELIVEAVDGLRDEFFDAVATQYLNESKEAKASGLSVANGKARARVDSAWRDEGSRRNAVSGKAVLRHVSRVLQEESGVSFSVVGLAREIKRDEIAEEVVKVLSSFRDGERWPISMEP